MDIADKFIISRKKDIRFTKEDWMLLLSQYQDPKIAKKLQKEAVKIRKEQYGNKVFIRGLIEFTNHCKNNCYYCGIRSGNKAARRYRLTKNDIMECCHYGYELGFRTFVLQGGEDAYYHDERIVDIVSSIKYKYPDCAVTLSIGEKTEESYLRYQKAGADRYLLRHETANEEHYRLLHPEPLSLSHRKECLKVLKKLGYQTGAGFMVGSPGQSYQTLAEDMMFLEELRPEMVGIGPFIPHHDTRFAEYKPGSVKMTLFLLSLVRILLPDVLLPATTALSTMDPDGQEKGILHGANVIMPNLSPLENRKQYELYDNKAYTGKEASEGLNQLISRMKAIGYEIVFERGDHCNKNENAES